MEQWIMTNPTSSEYSDGSAQETSSHECQGKVAFGSFSHFRVSSIDKNRQMDFDQLFSVEVTHALSLINTVQQGASKPNTAVHFTLIRYTDDDTHTRCWQYCEKKLRVQAVRVRLYKYYVSSCEEKNKLNKWPDTLSWFCQAGNKVAITEYMKMKWISVRCPRLAERDGELFNLRGASLPHDSVEIQYTRTPALTSSTSDNLLPLSPSFPRHLSFFLYVL